MKRSLFKNFNFSCVFIVFKPSIHHITVKSFLLPMSIHTNRLLFHQAILEHRLIHKLKSNHKVRMHKPRQLQYNSIPETKYSHQNNLCIAHLTMPVFPLESFLFRRFYQPNPHQLRVGSGLCDDSNLIFL